MSDYKGSAKSSFQLKSYVTTGVETSDPGKLVMQLFDELHKQLRYVEKNAPPANDATWDDLLLRLDRCQGIFGHLIQSVNPNGGELANNLMGLYFFCIREVAQLMLEKDSQRLENILPVVDQLRDGWAEMLREQKGS